MAIESNASEVAVGSALKQFTGISEFNVVAVNPTLEKLHELGIMPVSYTHLTLPTILRV